LSYSYRYFVTDATKNGVAQETIQNAVHRGSKMMTVEEARLILGVTEKTSWEDIVKVILSICVSLLIRLL
jgi:mitochondrial import inner membrane translocase subunit TIM16